MASPFANIRALARAATLIENRTTEGRELLAGLAGETGNALVVGITGPPGAGKSTLVDRITSDLRARNKRVAILAVDPSSPISGGAVLGDRIRMQTHHADPGVFIRSMASRGASGGIAAATRDLVTLLDAAEWDVVLVETVGVGQAETEIARHAGLTVVVLVPGLGDEVQSLKAGILEVADLFVINKADTEGADRLQREIHAISDRPIFQTVATEGTGVAALVDAILASEPNIHARAWPTAGWSIDHLGIAVKSIDGALRFYRDQLGLPVGHRETVEHEQVHVAMLPVEGSRIELIEAAEPDSTIARFVEKRGEGLHHVALRVRDFDAVVARLREAGVRIVNEPRRGAGGHEYVFVHPSSTGGVLLELIREES
jgi:LAO/AO transport system kinase